MRSEAARESRDLSTQLIAERQQSADIFAVKETEPLEHKGHRHILKQGSASDVKELPKLCRVEAGASLSNVIGYGQPRRPELLCVPE